MSSAGVVEESTVFSGPPFHIDLAPLDALHPIHYSRRLLIFRCASDEQRKLQLDAFKHGLQKLVSRCPVLGGIVAPLPADEATRNSNPDWRTVVPGPGIELTVRNLQTVLPSFSTLEADDFSSMHLLYDLLVPIPRDIDNTREYAACKMQFSAIEGGTIVTFAMSHSVADGSGTNELMRVLSDEVRFAQNNTDVSGSVVGQSLSTVNQFMGLDRNSLRGITSERPFEIDQHPAFTLNTPSADHAASSDRTKAAAPHPFEATSPEIPVILCISSRRLAQLKSDASSTTGAAPISTHDALAALIWRSVVLIRSRRSDLSRQQLANTQTNLFLPSDARHHLNLAPSYIGNAVYQLTAELDAGALLSQNGLQSAANALRRAIMAVDKDLVASYMATLKDKWVHWGFMGSYATTGVAMGTDWTSGILYEQDWGPAFGRLIRYRYPGGPGDAFCCIMPRLPEGQGAEVSVSCLPEEVPFLKSAECFGKYI